MKIIVCADDYALSPGVSAGIRQALKARSISATSVMALPPFWPAESKALRPYLGQADIGLHLTLTDQTPLAPMPEFAPCGQLPTLASLIAQASSGNLPLNEIRQEIERQFDAFEQALGHQPDHVDGHHYAHHLPGIRELVTETVQKRAPGAYIRSCHTEPDIIRLRGSGMAKALTLNEREEGFTEHLRRQHIASNRGFSGLYDFNGQETYATLFLRFLEGIAQGGLVVCHPGHVDNALCQRDPLTRRREEELSWLLGADYRALMAKRGLEISRFCEIFP